MNVYARHTIGNTGYPARFFPSRNGPAQEAFVEHPNNAKKVPCTAVLHFDRAGSELQQPQSLLFLPQCQRKQLTHVKQTDIMSKADHRALHSKRRRGATNHAQVAHSAVAIDLHAAAS